VAARLPGLTPGVVFGSAAAKRINSLVLAKVAFVTQDARRVNSFPAAFDIRQAC
jgi:hypothetical protein